MGSNIGSELRTPSVWLPALVTALIQLAGTFGARRRFPGLAGVHLSPYTVALLLAGPILLLARRRYPLPVLAGVIAVTAAYLHAGHRPGPVFLALVIAFLNAASTGPRWHTYPLPLIGWALFVWLRSPHLEVAGALGAWSLVLLAIAEGIRQRRITLEAGRQRREAMARDAASQARLAIARELHDVLAHSLSMINVQSGVALELLDTQPERAGPALAAIKDASRQAITDMHALVDALRTDGGVPTAPAPGIGDLDTLVSATRATGRAVTIIVHGEPHSLPAVIDTAAGRIVQEALTNVVRHSTATSATVAVTYGADALEVTVDDSGHPVDTTSSGGTGITGMTERAQALGGTVTAGSRLDGGFRITARLPLDGDR